MIRTILASVIAFAIVLPTKAGDDLKPIPHIGPIGKVTKLDVKFQFTEGPAPDSKGNVYFSDIPAEKIYKIDLAGKLSVFVEKSNHANGLKFNSKGELVACE